MMIIASIKIGATPDQYATLARDLKEKLKEEEIHKIKTNSSDDLEKELLRLLAPIEHLDAMVKELAANGIPISLYLTNSETEGAIHIPISIIKFLEEHQMNLEVD